MSANFRNVLVTGGAGFIGSHLVDAILERGASVTIFDNFSTGRSEFVLFNNPLVKVVRADVSDQKTLSEAMKGCDFVFHFQANADVRGGKEKTRVDLDQNILATWNVLEAMKINQVKNIAFASSSAVYGEPNVFPTPEDHPLIQTSLYGASKLAGEAMIQAYCEYFGMQCFIYRFVSWIGERYSHGVVFDFLKKLSKNREKLFILGNGKQRKSYLYVKDGVSGIMKGIQNSQAQKNVFNLGHHEYLDVVQLAKIVLDEMQLPNVELEFSGTERGWVGDSPFVHLDTSRIRSLGWIPQTSIEEGIRRTVRFLLANPQIMEERL
jgi:UDP-glucose 4-epimerase